MRLDWHYEPVCKRLVFNAGKLAKSWSILNIADTKPVDSVPIASFGKIERNVSSAVKSGKPWLPRPGVNYAEIWLARTVSRRM